VGLTTSGAEHAARWASGARVVKAFNHVYAEVLSSPEAMSTAVTLFIAGDDHDAKETVSSLARSVGFDPVEAGPLASARYLEPLAMLMVELVRGQGLGPADITVRLARHRAASSGAPLAHPLSAHHHLDQTSNVGLVAREP